MTVKHRARPSTDKPSISPGPQRPPKAHRCHTCKHAGRVCSKHRQYICRLGIDRRARKHLKCIGEQPDGGRDCDEWEAKLAAHHLLPPEHDGGEREQTT